MRIFNADGSEGLMCGNGLRCVMRWLHDTGRVAGSRLAVETASGLRRGQVSADGSVEVEMGLPVFLPEAIPVRAEGDPPEVPLPAGLTSDPDVGFCVSIGNPHVVVSVSDPETVDLAAVGPALERSELFPERVNVHVVGRRESASGVLVVRTWERGSGATRACGTGAVAVAAVARRVGWVEGDVTTVVMPGGRLTVTWDGTGPARLAGGAQLVFTGEWPES
jgi:diaminopimelate epimerase